MQLEAGKKYTDRRGRVYGPMRKVDTLFGEDGDEFGNWFSTGESFINFETSTDLVAEYVEPAPVESPDDLVIQDRVPARNGIDYGWFAPCLTDAPSYPWSFRSGVSAEGKKHGDKMTWGEVLNVYCRRKDLPPVPEKFPQYYVCDDWSETAYVVRVVEDAYRFINKDGTESKINFWRPYEKRRVAEGSWKQVTKEEAESRVKRTRTVVLKEWICWDDDDPQVMIVWASQDPSEELDSDHAHATGNTRTVEVPVN